MGKSQKSMMDFAQMRSSSGESEKILDDMRSGMDNSFRTDLSDVNLYESDMVKNGGAAAAAMSFSNDFGGAGGELAPMGAGIGAAAPIQCKKEHSSRWNKVADRGDSDLMDTLNFKLGDSSQEDEVYKPVKRKSMHGTGGFFNGVHMGMFSGWEVPRLFQWIRNAMYSARWRLSGNKGKIFNYPLFKQDSAEDRERIGNETLI